MPETRAPSPHQSNVKSPFQSREATELLSKTVVWIFYMSKQHVFFSTFVLGNAWTIFADTFQKKNFIQRQIPSMKTSVQTITIWQRYKQQKTGADNGMCWATLSIGDSARCLWCTWRPSPAPVDIDRVLLVSKGIGTVPEFLNLSSQGNCSTLLISFDNHLWTPTTLSLSF